MTLLEQIRAENPSLELIPDEELIDRIVEQYQGDIDPETFRKSLTSQVTENQAQLAETAPVASATVQPTAGKRPIGVGSDPDEIGYGEAFASGLKSMWQRTWGPGVNYLKGGISGLLGDEETAQRYYQEARQQDQEILNRTGYITFDQAVNGPDAGIDTFVKFGLQQAGMSLPYTLFGGVGGIAGRAVLGKAIGKTAATMTGATASFLPTTAQFNIARQVEEVERGNLDEVNEAAAFGAALPAAVLESALYPVLGKLFGPLSRTQFSNVISRATLGRVAKGSATGAVTEAITEVGQQAIERYQAGLPIDSPDAINEYKEAAAGAAFVGGLFGGATTTAGELARTVQPTPTDAPVTKPVEAPAEAPKVEAGIIQPQQQKETAQTEATQEQAKPVNFSVEKEADRFVVKRQDLDENNNVVKTTPIGAPTTEEAATKLQQEAQDQKNKLPEQTFFTADEIKQQDPTLGNIIDEVESQGAKISPGTKQVYYRKDLALPQGDLTNVMNSGGTANSVADGWYDRTSDLVYVSLADLGKVKETVAHENFHALQRVTDRVSPNLFTEQEQTALDTFLPGGTIDSIAPNVQRALGNDVMNTLRERHADRNISNREMQAYAFGAYATLRNNNKLLSAPNPVIRAFRKLFDFIKRAGNIFRKNKINDVKDIFDKARLGEIGKRAKPQPDADALRAKSLAQAEKAAAKGVVPTKFEYSVTTKKYRGRNIGTILPSLDSVYGSDIFEEIYNSAARKPQVKQNYLRQVAPEQRTATSAIVDIGYVEKELIDDNGYLVFQEDGKSYRIGVQTGGRNVSRDYTPQELTQIGNSLKTALSIQETRKTAPEFALSRVDIREDIKSNKNTFGKKYNLKTSIEDGVKENLSKIAIALDKEHEAKYGVIKQTPRIVKGKIAEEDKKIFDDAVEAGYQELKYQLELGRETKVSGVGWYNRAITQTIERVKNIIPKMKEGTVLEQKDKELQFKLFLALFSPQGGPVQNLDVAAEVFKKYLDTGIAPEGRSIYTDSPKFGVSHQSMLKSLKLVDYLIKKHGKNPGDFTEYMYSTKTYKQLGKEKLQSGFFVPAKNQKKQELDYSDLSGVNKTSFNTDTGKQEETLLMPAFMFGEKVGNFFLNFNGIEGVTKDRWFSRHYYRQFGQVGIARNPKTGKPLKSETKLVKDMSGKKIERTYPPGHDPVTKLRDTTKANDKQVSELYVAAIRDRAKEEGILKGEDATKQNVQAVLWYFEQGLYTDLGLKSVPIDYVQATDILEKKIINDTKLKGESYGQFYNTAVIKGTAADVKTRSKKEKTTLTKNRTEEVKTELELSVSTDTAVRDIDVNAFQKSGSDVTSFNPEEYRKQSKKRGVLVGHCAACTYVVQKNFGGDIMKVLVSPIKGYNSTRESHYFNRLPDGTFIDLTGEQYGNKGITPPEDFIKRAKVSPYQWGRFDPKKSKEENKASAGVVSINPKFIKFEERYNQAPELSVSSIKIKNQIDNVETPSFSISLPKKTFKNIVGFEPRYERGDPMRPDDPKINELFNVYGIINEFGPYFVIKAFRPGYTFDLFKKDIIDRSSQDSYVKSLTKALDNGNYVSIELNAFESRTNELNLSAIGVPKKEGRGKGLASEALKEILAQADKDGTTVTGTISPFGEDKGLGVRALRDWYFRNGFEFVDENQSKVKLKDADIIRKPQEVQNLDELTPELSISKDKKLLNPPGSKITVDLAEDLETLENFGIQPTDNVKEEVELLADKLFDTAVEDFGDLQNIEATGLPIFVAGIKVDGKPVGFIQGARTGDIGYIDFVGFYGFGDVYLSPIGFRRVGKQLAKLTGVKKFAGNRITGSRKKQEDIKNKYLDKQAISADFSQQQFDEADSVQFSVSDKMLTDKEMQDSALPSNVKAKLFENRKLKEGTPVSIRPNLNGQVVRDDKKLFVQTIHPGKDLSKALGYDGAVRVTDPFLNVSQKARANIASKRQNKFPMAAAQGKLSKKEATLEGQVLNFNPFQHHLFVDSAGYAVKSIKGDAVMFNTKVYTTGTLNYYSREDAPTPLENIESNVLYKYETEAEKKADQPLETDTLSKEKLREFNLEFAASDEGITSEVQQVMDVVNPQRSRKTIAAHWKDFVDNWTVKFRQAVTDQYISVKKFVGEEEYKALTMTYGSSGATEAALLYGVPFMDNDGAIDLKANTIGTGLFTRFEKLGDKLEQFLVWVAANRARVLAGKGFTTGFPDVTVLDKAIKDLYKIGGKAFDDAYKDLTEFNNAFLDIAVKSGYLDPASAKVWKEDNGYNFYIPFYRLLEDPDSNSGPKSAADIVNQPDYPKFRGSNLPVNDLMRNIIRNYAFLTEASLKNAAGFKTLEKAVEMGVATRVPNRTKTSVFVRNKGKIQHYEVENKLVLESLTALNWNGWQNPAMGALRTFKRYLTYGVTASPAFRIRNLLRDSIHSVAVGPLKYNPIENVMEGGKGLLNKKKGESELRARLAFGGGSIHFGHIYGDDPNATQMLLDRAIDVNTVMKRDGFTAGARRIINSRLKNALKNWEEVGSFGENVNRAALYKQLRDKGVSHFEAAYQARDLLNFSRHGASPAIRFLTQSIPFLNARIQGLDKLGRAMTKGQRAQLISVLGTYSLASIGLYLAYKDDEDFKAREQWDRDTYHWFKIPGTEGAIRLPRPFEVGAIGVIFERMVEQMVDDDVHGQLLAERISHVITETFAIDIRPQLITPALEVYANKDSFTGRPIESMGMKRLPASERKYAYTSSSYVGASKLLELVSFNQVTLSPVQIEHLVQGYFGWVGSTVVSAVSFVDYPRKAAEFFTTGWDTPLGMGFFKGLPSVQSKYKTQFYNQLTSMNEVFNLMRLYESRGEYKKALEVAEKNKNVLQWRKAYVKVNTKINQINREIRRIEADKNLSEAEKIDKVRQLNIIKNDMIQNLTEAVLSWEKSTGQRVKRPLWWNK